MYRALELFTDLQDNNYKYQAGDEYPRQGLIPTKKRINELLSDNNRRHRPVIEEIKDEVSDTKEIEEVKEPVAKKTPPKKKGGKKTDAK